MKGKLRKILPLGLVLIIVGLAYWYLSDSGASAEQGGLYASGTIEAPQVVITSQIGGQVAVINVHQGDQVELGQELIRLDDAIMQAQLSQAKAAVVQAESNRALVAAGIPKAQRDVAIAAAELEVIHAQQVIDELYDKVELMSAQAGKEYADGRNTVRLAERRVDSLLAPASEIDLDIAKSTVILTEAAIKRVERELKRLLAKPEDNPKRAAAVLLVSVLKKQHDFAVRRFNYLEEGPNDITIAQAEADLLLAQAALNDAEQQYEQVSDGPDPDLLVLAEARLITAQANLAAAQAEPSQEQLALAESQVGVAYAGFDVVGAQIQKLSLSAPLDGIVINRSVELGEVVAPGAPLLTIARLITLRSWFTFPKIAMG
jgi:multidrug resistance efflux pump